MHYKLEEIQAHVVAMWINIWSSLAYTVDLFLSLL